MDAPTTASVGNGRSGGEDRWFTPHTLHRRWPSTLPRYAVRSYRPWNRYDAYLAGPPA